MPENGKVTTCMDRKAWKNYVKIIIKRFGNKKGFKNFYRNFHKYGNNVFAITEALGKQDFSAFSNRQLCEAYKKFRNAWTVYMCYLWIGWILNDIIADKAQTILKKKGLLLPSYNHIVNGLCSPIKRVGVLALQNELSKYKSRKLKSLPKQALVKLTKKYAWLPCMDFHNNPWTKKNIQEFYLKLEDLKTQLSFAKAAALANLSSQEIGFFNQLRTVAYIKDMRDVYRRKSACNIIPLFNEIAKHTGSTRHQIAYCTYGEIEKALIQHAKLPLKLANLRIQGYVMYIKEKNMHFSVKSKDIKTYTNKISGPKNSVLKGMVANPGKATGKAVIVKNSKDFAKMRTGNILIAVTTHPEFVPVMQKASAIVTDEGGITSHAAIVSRELGIPCVVRTHHASKVFKDGNLVEVDANNGMVRKI